MIYQNFSREALYDLIRAYDLYIYKASDAELMKNGWEPCGVTEFYEEEYQNVWLNREDDYDCWNYMYKD